MRSCVLLAGCLLSGLDVPARGSAAAPHAAHRLVLTLRRRSPDDGGAVRIRREKVVWDARKTAAIVCDMWDKHWCKGATRRVGQMAPRMNELLAAARAKGALIIHAPSGTMTHYRNHPARKRAQDAPRAKDLPKGIGGWCRRMASEAGAAWPLDQSDGGCDCQPTCKQGRAWSQQLGAIEIRDADAISDSGEEVWNLLAARGIEHVLLMGVHTNMCVIGRPFGLRNLKRFGKDVVLVRDLTDTMYNPRKAPFVSHFRGTELIVEYIETRVCPTVLSSDVTRAGRFRFPGDPRKRVVFAIAEGEYHTWETLPAFAERVLADKCSLAVELLFADPQDRNVIPHLADALGAADLLFLSVRRRALPAADLQAVRAHVKAGRPVVGIRTASHAFDTRGKHPDGHAEWRTFDPDVLGGHYSGHHGNGPKTTVSFAKAAGRHPILSGIRPGFVVSGSLYRTSPLAKGTTPLLIGTISGKEPEPLAWTNACGTARVFYTSLGHPDDFAGKDPPTVRLLTNAVFWALDRPVPQLPPQAAKSGG